MKLALSLVTTFVALSFSAHANSQNDANEAMAKAAINSNVAVAAILKQSAGEVAMRKEACKTQIELKVETDEFNEGKTVSGDVVINQICHNAEVDGATNTTIKGTISSNRMLIDSVEISHAGF